MSPCQQEIIMKKVQQLLPEKRTKIASDDQPWVNEGVKKIKKNPAYG